MTPFLFSTEPRRILLLARDMLGDLVNTTGAVAAIRDRFPNALIILEGGPAVTSLFESSTNFLVQKRRRGGLAAKAARVLGYRRGRFDLAIVLDDGVAHARLARLGGIKVVIGCHRQESEKKFFSASVPFDRQGHDLFPTLDGILHLVGAGGSVSPRLPVRAAPHLNTVGLFLDASDIRKMWPVDRWVTLTKLLKESGSIVSVATGPEGGPYSEAFERASGIRPHQEPDLMRFAAWIGTNSILVTADTGPAHMAAALDVPTVVLYGPTDPVRFHPWGSKWIAIRKQPDCDHYGHGCSFRDTQGLCSRTCMSAISPAEVVEAIHNLLDGPH